MFIFEIFTKILGLLQNWTRLQVELLDPLSLSPVYSVAVGASVRGVLSFWLASSMFGGAFSWVRLLAWVDNVLSEDVFLGGLLLL